MLCPSRWVIPGLAAGVTGWPASQRVAGGSRSSRSRAGARADVRAPGPGCRRDGWLGCCGQLGREIRVRGKAGRERIVKISYEAARSVDRYLRVRAKHALAARPELWLGINGRGPVTPDGIYRIVANAGKKAAVAVYPHRFRHHFSHTWLDRGGAGGGLMELNGWSSPQMLEWYGGSARGARARRSYDRIMNG
jgi:integrase